MAQVEMVPVDAYRVVSRAFCGMAELLVEGEEMRHARKTAARELRRRRAMGLRVWALARGHMWECHEPEDALMVPDEAGTLSIQQERRPAVECWQCGEMVLVGDWHECPAMEEM